MRGMGLLVLFAVAALLIVVVGSLALAHRMTHPNRRTMGVALAHGLPVEPSEVGMEADQIVVRLADETKTPMWIIKGDQTDGPVVLATHGWSSSRYGMLRLAAMLAPHASRIVLYDLRGHGESTASITTLGVRETDDLVELLDHVMIEDRPLVLFGSSLGATTALRAAVVLKGRDSPKLLGLILQAPYSNDAEPVIGHFKIHGAPPQPFVFLATMLLKVLVRGYGAYDAVALARELDCDLLVLHGTADPISPHDSARRIAEAAPRSTFVEFGAAGHSRLAQHAPDRYLEAVETFFQKIYQNANARANAPTSK